jgi:hypothetical protein
VVGVSDVDHHKYQTRTFIFYFFFSFCFEATQLWMVQARTPHPHSVFTLGKVKETSRRAPVEDNGRDKV